jgi:hypothetical protein
MMTRPRAADDFPAIRARMEELRRERVADEAGGDPLPKTLVGRPLIVNPRTPKWAALPLSVLIDDFVLP